MSKLILPLMSAALLLAACNKQPAQSGSTPATPNPGGGSAQGAASTQSPGGNANTPADGVSSGGGPNSGTGSSGR